MQSINCKINQLFFIACFGFMFLQPQSAFAKCGGVDYSWGADALSNAHDFTVTMMLYVVYLLIMKKCRFPWKNIMMVLKVVT